MCGICGLSGIGGPGGLGELIFFTGLGVLSGVGGLSCLGFTGGLGDLGAEMKKVGNAVCANSLYQCYFFSFGFCMFFLC